MFFEISTSVVNRILLSVRSTLAMSGCSKWWPNAARGSGSAVYAHSADSQTREYNCFINETNRRISCASHTHAIRILGIYCNCQQGGGNLAGYNVLYAGLAFGDDCCSTDPREYIPRQYQKTRYELCLNHDNWCANKKCVCRGKLVNVLNRCNDIEFDKS